VPRSLKNLEREIQVHDPRYTREEALSERVGLLAVCEVFQLFGCCPRLIRNRAPSTILLSAGTPQGLTVIFQIESCPVSDLPNSLRFGLPSAVLGSTLAELDRWAKTGAPPDAADRSGTGIAIRTSWKIGEHEIASN
jgi:hypothetical protein